MSSDTRLSGIAHVTSLLDIPVRTRLSMQPTLMAISPLGHVGDLLHDFEAMGQTADAAIAMVLRNRREDALRAFDPEYATRSNGSRPSSRRGRRHGSLDAPDPGRNVADEGNGDWRNREP